MGAPKQNNAFSNHGDQQMLPLSHELAVSEQSTAQHLALGNGKRKWSALNQESDYVERQSKRRCTTKRKQRVFNGISCICWNVDGKLRNTLKSTAASKMLRYEIEKSSPDIVLVQEAVGTKGRGYQSSTLSDLQDLNGYRLAVMDPLGVTAIYVKSSIRRYSPISIFQTNDPLETVHASAVELPISSSIRGRKSIVFGCFYRSPNSKDARSALSTMEAVLNRIRGATGDSKPNILMGGDANIWSESIGSDPLMRAERRDKFEAGDHFFDVMDNQGMQCVVNKQPTMWKRDLHKSNTVLFDDRKEFAVDTLWLTNGTVNQLTVKCHFDRNVAVVDHYPNKILLCFPGREHIWHCKQKEGKWNVVDAGSDDWNRFDGYVESGIKRLDEVMLEPFRQSSSNTRSSAILDAAVQHIQDMTNHAAKHSFKKYGQSDPTKAWMTPDIKEIIEETHKLRKPFNKISARIKRFRRKLPNTLTEDEKLQRIKQWVGERDLQIMRAFQIQQRFKKKKIRNAKRQWQMRKVRALRVDTNGKKWWETLNELEAIALNQSKHQSIPRMIKPKVFCVDPNKEERAALRTSDFTMDDSETANEINDYFNSIGTVANPNYKNERDVSRERARELDREFDFDPETHPNHRTELEKLTADFTETELNFHAQQLQNNKSYGVDEMHTNFLKRALPLMKDWLLRAFNNWKERGLASSSVLTRRISPICKPGKANDVVKGLRPVSVETIIWKLYQKMVDHRIRQYVINLDIISEHQFAGKRGTGSEDCVIDIALTLERIRSSGICGQPVHVLSIDSSDAYDSMKVDILGDKLVHHLGFDQRGLTMAMSLLRGRTSITIVNGSESAKIVTRSGPFQGGPPSGTFWIIYINPLQLRINGGQKMIKNGVVESQVHAKALMDDVTLISEIHSFSIALFKAKDVMKRAAQLFQDTILMAIDYLNTNNVPTNQSKTQLLTVSALKKQQKGDSELSRLWRKYEEETFVVDGRESEKKQCIKVLGVLWDHNLSFTQHISKIKDEMAMVRGRASRMLRSNQNRLSLGAIRLVIQSAAYQRLHYGGCLFLNKKDQAVNPLRVEYNKLMRLLVGDARFISNEEIATFSGLDSFEDCVVRLNSKMFCKIIRANNTTSLRHHRDRLIKKTKEFERSVTTGHLRVTLSWNEQKMECHVNKLKATDTMFAWIGAARKIIHSDYKIVAGGRWKMQNVVEIGALRYIPGPKPWWLKVHNVSEQWTDDQINPNALTLLTDGSVFPTEANRRLQVHGHGGGAIVAYYGGERVFVGISPISARTHISITEMETLGMAFRYIDQNVEWGRESEVNQQMILYRGKPITKVDIVTDSQSCLKRIDHQQQKGGDDAFTESFRRTDAAIQRLSRLQLPADFVELHWVHSHAESHLNEEVDVFAKVAAQVVGMLHDADDPQNKNSFSTTKYIGLQTVKREVKALVQCRAEQRWNEYLHDRRGSDNKQLFKWRIPKLRDYRKELFFVEGRDAAIRILLYNGTLPLNVWQMQSRHGMGTADDTDLCPNKECKERGISEDLHHFIAVCPQYLEQREELKRNVEWIQKAHNQKYEFEAEENQVEFITDWNDPKILKQIIFPSLKLEVKDRTDILNEVIRFVRRSQRFGN